ncbi:Hpt domain-containing protein [Roseomonas sp. KE0001]|uniref:Hpt domain-containing protein n=1 Tax=Roseomonas sp. KE0001 TaxID=2479201 RepID=UPI0018DEF344|nr:hypothetical protein [Roseomonas sp. KE0001]
MQAIDPTTVAILSEGLPPDVFLTILRTFEHDLAELGERMAVALGERDMAAFSQGAHALAGAAGSLGAQRLAHQARLAMRQATPEAASALLAGVQQELRLVLAELRDLAAASPPG